MTLRITQINVSGISAPQDEAVDQTYIKSAYEALDNFSIDIVFEGEYVETAAGTEGVPGAETYTYAYAVDVTSTFDWASIGLTYSKPNAYTVRLHGPASNVFSNQYYKFKMTDGTEQILDADTTEPFFSIIQYQMPSPTFVKKVYPFSVIVPAGLATDPLLGGGGYNAGPYKTGGGVLIPGTTETVSLDMSQWMYWRYEVAKANIESAKARGLR